MTRLFNKTLLVTHLRLFFPSALSEIPRSAFRETLQRILSPHTGNVVAEPSEVIAVCQSLQRVAEKCQLDPESCWYFHQTAIPCLLALAVQASMPGNFLHLTSYLSSRPLPSTSEQHCHPRVFAGTAFYTSRGSFYNLASSKGC